MEKSEEKIKIQFKKSTPVLISKAPGKGAYSDEIKTKTYRCNTQNGKSQPKNPANTSLVRQWQGRHPQGTHRKRFTLSILTVKFSILDVVSNRHWQHVTCTKGQSSLMQFTYSIGHKRLSFDRIYFSKQPCFMYRHMFFFFVIHDLFLMLSR